MKVWSLVFGLFILGTVCTQARGAPVVVRNIIDCPGFFGEWYTTQPIEEQEIAACLIVETKNHNLEWVDFIFKVLEDQSKWEAKFILGGKDSKDDLISNEVKPFILVSNVDKDVAWLSSSLRTVPDETGGWAVIGCFHLFPAEIEEAFLDYHEEEPFELAIYGKKSWKMTLVVRGHFIAETPEEAKRIGALFVPEPSSVILVLAGSIIALCKRKNKLL